MCAKILYQVELQRKSLDQMWGFSVEAELMENADRQDELCCYVSRVEDKSVAMHSGIIKSDEIMVINGAIVSDLDMMYLESVLQEEQSLCMMMRSSRTEPPDLATIMRATDDIIDSLVCPPPPSEPPVISEEMISGLIVPAPGWSEYGGTARTPLPIFGRHIKVRSVTDYYSDVRSRQGDVLARRRRVSAAAGDGVPRQGGVPGQLLRDREPAQSE